MDKNNGNKIENNSQDFGKIDDEKFESDEEIGLFSEQFRRIVLQKNPPQLNNNLKTETNVIDELDINKNENDVEKKNNHVNVKKKNFTLSIIDTFIAISIVGPLVIGHWRGLWSLLDFYEFPNGWICFLTGTGLHWTFAMLRENFHGLFVDSWRTSNPIGRGGYRAVRLIYTWIFCFACNMQWRGGWDLFSSFISDDFRIVGSITVTMIFILMLLRCSRNLLAPPFIVVVDIPNYVFRFPTRYKKNTQDWTLYVLDCAFSVGVVGSLVVFVWRGVWVLLDLHLFPGEREHSAICSMIIGYVIVAITFCLQPVMRYACTRLQDLPRLLAADAFLLLSFLGTVNVWRGIWSMLDQWFFPEDVELSCWITHIGCFVFLGLLNCSNSILVRGVYIDAEEEEGRCVVFPCHYLRSFFKVEREKKEARRRNLLALSRGYTCNDGNGKDVENGALLNCTSPTIIPPREGNTQG